MRNGAPKLYEKFDILIPFYLIYSPFPLKKKKEPVPEMSREAVFRLEMTDGLTLFALCGQRKLHTEDHKSSNIAGNLSRIPKKQSE